MEIIYYVAASLDGFIATPDGGIEWLKPFEGGEEDYGYAAFYASVDCVVMGRRTYEQCLAFPQWPYPEKACWVLSRGRAESANPAAVVSKMKADGRKRAWLVGGGAAAAAFRAERLITEYIVSVVPVLLGAGIPLFAGAAAKENLALAAAQSYASGIVQLRHLNP